MKNKFKKIVSMLLVVLCEVSITVARERLIDDEGHAYYVYVDKNEFYKYWEEAARAYSYVQIGILLTQEDHGYGFASLLREFDEMVFYYVCGTKQLVALFTNHAEVEDGFERFSTGGGVYSYNAALRYWNVLIDNM